MEPVLPQDRERTVQDLAIDLVAKASELIGQIRPEVRKSVGELVRSMNCYYSNLIEGHNTHPRDIDRAMEDKYSKEPNTRALQLEARAHIEIQRMIDTGEDPAEPPASEVYLRWIHREFCRRLPEELLVVESPSTELRVTVVPGEFRDGDIQVGRHIPPAADKVVPFLRRFEQAYTSKHESRLQSIVGSAAAHHRFLWIHPFYDGNGRVARLMSHAMLLRAGVGSSLWSIARGLARSNAEYKQRLMAADSRRLDDYDGRGARSDSLLTEFCIYFLRVCIDQVEFMGSLIQPNELLRRMKLYCDDEVSAGRLPKRSMALLREALLAGQFARGRAPEITGYQERRAREILAVLLQKRLLVSTGPRAPVRLGFPLDVVERWFPVLYPVQ